MSEPLKGRMARMPLPGLQRIAAPETSSSRCGVTQRLGDPRPVVVAGSSAGSYGAIFHAPRIARLYPFADLVTIDDSGVPLLNGYEEILERSGAGSVLRPAWGPAQAQDERRQQPDGTQPYDEAGLPFGQQGAPTRSLFEVRAADPDAPDADLDFVLRIDGRFGAFYEARLPCSRDDAKRLHTCTVDARRGICVTDPPAPVFGGAESPARQPSLSKRGQHIRSMQPLRPTSAAVVQSPITA